MLDVRKKIAILPPFPIESYVLFVEVFLQFDGVKLIGLRAFFTTLFLVGHCRVQILLSHQLSWIIVTQAGKVALSPRLPLLQNLRTGGVLLKLQCKRFATWHILKPDLTSHAVL